MGLMLPPDCVRWINRNGEDNDCAIAAIALATGFSYEVVLGTAMTVDPAAPMSGMTLSEVKATLRKLGVPYRVRRKFDIDDGSGLLWVSKGAKTDHMVYLWEGRVVEPSLGSRSLWLTADAYLAHEGYKANWLIELKTS